MALSTVQRKDSGEDYDAFVRPLAEASGLEPPPRREFIEFDRRRKRACCSDPGLGPGMRRGCRSDLDSGLAMA